jgi:hypothetical protein
VDLLVDHGRRHTPQGHCVHRVWDGHCRTVPCESRCRGGSGRSVPGGDLVGDGAVQSRHGWFRPQTFHQRLSLSHRLMRDFSPTTGIPSRSCVGTML